MIKCPKCDGEIRYIVGASSSGNPGNPIAIDIATETLISKSGRRIEGYREHICHSGVSNSKFVEVVRAIFNEPDGDLDNLLYRLQLARNMEAIHG